MKISDLVAKEVRLEVINQEMDFILARTDALDKEMDRLIERGKQLLKEMKELSQ